MSHKSDSFINDPKLTWEAIKGELSRQLKEMLEPIHERIDRVEDSINTHHEKSHQTHRRRRFDDREGSDGYYDDDGEYSVGSHRGIGRNRREDDNMRGIKMKIPAFQGKSDPEAYLEWERKIEFIFDCHDYSEAKKVKLVVIEFSDYAITWWDQLVWSRRRNRERPM